MDKLEKHIKSTLAERKIQPSKSAWDAIDAQLGNTPKRKSKWAYYAIAASFIGVLVASGIYVLVNGNQVEQPAVEEVVDAQKVDEEAYITTGTVVQNTNETTEKQAAIQSAEPFAKNDGAKETTTLAIEQHHQDAVKQPDLVDTTTEQQILVPVVTAQEESIITKKLNEVLAQVTHLEAQNIQVSDAEVDSLLRAAQQEILTEKLFQESGKVDAMALLDEVEGELDQSFRDQIFEKLKDGFFKVRTAVADRNN